MRSLASARPDGGQAPRAALGARAAGLSNRALARGACTPDMARSLAPSLGNRASGALLQRKSVCDAPPPDKYKEKAGKTREQTTPSLDPTVANLVGGKAWELYNFDVDKSFVKVEHEAYIRDTVVPALKKLMERDGAYAMVVGEASTTASFGHNLTLSQERAQCVIAILKRELKAAGVADVDKVLRPWGASEALAMVRRLRDEFEHEEDRLVTIVPVDRDPDQREDLCPESARTRASERFKIKYACGGPGQVKVNIGDVSVKGQHTYRRFRWITLPGETCRFRAATDGDARYGARHPFSLALRDPDQAWAPSDLVGEAALQAGSGWLFAAGGKFSVQLKGTWPATCKTAAGEVRGFLMAEGPVLCGDVPQPEREPSCDDKPQACTVAERTAPAKKFAAHMERFASDLPIDKLLKRLPAWARHLVKKLGVVPQGGVALVTIGTRDGGPEPRRMRRFLFAGAGLDGDGLDGNVGFDKEMDASEPMRLSTDDPDYWDDTSDFDHWVRAKLEIKRGTNVEELRVGYETFSFHGLKCNGSSSTLWGYFGGVGGVDCDDIGDLPEPPERDCGKDDCPEGTQLAEHDEFTFKIGRASLRDLPAVGKPLADRLGCKVVAARVNIGATAADPIYREFLFLGRRTGCRFDVGQGQFDQKYTLDRQLSIFDPELAVDPSDFSGLAKLTADGKLAVRPATATGFTVTLPGTWDGACKGDREIEGALVPIDDVKCGEVPDPKHDTTPDDTGLELCQDLGTVDARTKTEIERLRTGDYDYIVEHVDRQGRPPLLEYTDDIQKLSPGQVLTPAVFVGRNFEGVPVVTLVEMEVVTYFQDARGNAHVSVRFLSDACSYDKDGNAVFVLPFRCREVLPYKGLFTPLTSVPSPGRPKQRPAPGTDPPPPESGAGAGSRSAALATSPVAVLAER